MSFFDVKNDIFCVLIIVFVITIFYMFGNVYKSREYVKTSPEVHKTISKEFGLFTTFTIYGIV